ncbi:MAG: S8 family serine peptidase [Ignavibacteria bacterium]|nr:S8 family peptidase [Ignavibacteria bacterium]
MKKLITLLSFIAVIVLSGYTQNNPSDKISRQLLNSSSKNPDKNLVVWIYLTDKGPGALSKLSNPLNIVSQRSFERRLKVKTVAQALDFTDVPLNDAYVNEIKEKVIKIRNRSKWLNAVSAEVTSDQLSELANLDFVKVIDLVERFRKAKNNIEFNLEQPESYTSLPNSILADTLNYGTGNALTQISQIKVNEVHNDGIFGQGILVANFDAGFSNMTHEVFTTYPMNIISTYDFQNHTPVLTGHSHGTATLSLTGGYKPGQMISPAFKSKFILARTEVDPTETPSEMDNWIAAAEWADSLGADVITSSLGYLDFDAPYSSYTWLDMNGNTLPITKAADLAVNKGIVVSNSAGNSGSSSNNTLIGPADGDSVITVGAVTSGGSRSSFSSVGPTTDIPARIKPDIMTMGSSNYVAGTSGNSYYNGSGTSFACPLNSGVCALILSANKNLTPIQVRDILRKFGSNNNTPDNLMGWGIINAKKSVDTARKLDTQPPVIQHTQTVFSVRTPGPVIIKSVIRDNGIIRKRTNEYPVLYYRTNAYGTISPYSSVTAYNSVSDTFYFSIPQINLKATVEYYFAAQDVALPVPLSSTLPSGGSGVNPAGSNPPNAKFSFRVYPYSYNANPVSVNIITLNNYPNPFNPETMISYYLDKGGRITLKVYDISGKELAVLADGIEPEGAHEIRFNGGNLSSGVYFYKLITENKTLVKQMILLK